MLQDLLFSSTAVPEQYLPLYLGLCSTKQLKNTIEIDSINSIGHYEIIKLCSEGSINLKKTDWLKEYWSDLLLSKQILFCDNSFCGLVRLELLVTSQ